MLSQKSAKLNRCIAQIAILIHNKYLAIPSKVNLNFLMIYPPVNIPVARDGRVVAPRNERKIVIIYSYSEMALRMKHCVHQPNLL